MTTDTLRDRACSAVLMDIVNGRLTVDSVIHEKALRERLHVSKAPVREALIAPCSKGILRSAPRTGCVAARYAVRDLRDMLACRTMLNFHLTPASFTNNTPAGIWTTR